jgi:hypothetical protein
MIMKNLDKYLQAIRDDYANWLLQTPTDIRIKMTEEFQNSVGYEVGSKYIRVYAGANQRSVHSFICIKDNGKFKEGDILKAAGWAGPARNFARGNILDGNFSNVRWTGA